MSKASNAERLRNIDVINFSSKRSTDDTNLLLESLNEVLADNNFKFGKTLVFKLPPIQNSKKE